MAVVIYRPLPPSLIPARPSQSLKDWWAERLDYHAYMAFMESDKNACNKLHKTT